jgi:hypothetical protein
MSVFPVLLRFRCSYDFGYLLKLVTCLPLPTTEAEFFEARAYSHLHSHGLTLTFTIDARMCTFLTQPCLLP